jgi:AcrR family transcriptional regulator
MSKIAPARTAKFEAKQELILNAAARLFNARGVRATTLADVAGEVELATNSVTYYYKRKEDLASACFLRSISTMREIIEQAAGEATADARIRRFIMNYGAMLEGLARQQNRDLVTFKEVRAMIGADRARLFDMYGEMFRAGRSLFGTETGLSRRALNARTHLLLTAAVWTRNWIEIYDLNDYPRVCAAIADILIRGLGADGAHWRVTSDDPFNFHNGPTNGEISNDLFLQAATRLVNEQGYVGASVDKISAELKVTKGAFYHYIDKKDELITSCFRRTLDVVRNLQLIAAERNASGWARLCDCAQLFVRYHLSPHGPLIRFTSWVSLPEPMRSEMRAEIERVTQRFSGFFVDGMIDGSLRILDQSVASHLLSGCLNASAELQNWVADVGQDEGAEIYIKPLFMGILSKQ